MIRAVRGGLACLALAIPAAGCPTAFGAVPATIRVGGPSAPGDAKVALVGASTDLTGRAFRVIGGSGSVVLRGRLTRSGGRKAPWRHVMRADLTRLRTPGAYTVEVGALRSRHWVVRTRALSAPIAAILRFFAANADGREPSPAHAPAHLNDAVVSSGPHAGERFDLTGGWMDAGDMLKFTNTTAFVAAALQAAARLDPDDAARLTTAADVGVRWLVKAHPATDLFIAQVGDERDHELGFRDPASDDSSGKPGIARRLAYPNMGGDIGGKAAAALGLAAQRASGAQRDALLTQARQWYAAGKASGGPAPKLPASVGDFYIADTSADALAAGAAVLWRETGEQAFIDDAIGFIGQITPDGRLMWNAMAGFAAADLCGVLGAPPVPDATARAVACDALAAQGAVAVARSRLEAFGTPGDFSWGQTADNAGGGAITALAARARRLPGGRAIATAARDWMLGRNPWGASFVTGYGPNAPRHPHHWASMSGPGRPVGAVVGGPAPLKDLLAQGFGVPRRSVFSVGAATYEDRLADYVTSEPAIDYSVASILLLATLR